MIIIIATSVHAW